MRMWMIDPKILCKKHLLGEHGEIHKHKHNFIKGHKIDGRMYPIVTIEPFKMQVRHDELVKEMLSRGYNHQSPYILPDLSNYEKYKCLKVNINYNLKDLFKRCPTCRKRYEKFYG